jgi:predicted aconitase
MPPALTGRRREIGVDVEEARAGDVTFEIELPAALRRAELPATVDELVAQAYQLPFDGGSGTEAGWIT